MILKLQSGGALPPFADYTPIPSTFSNPFESSKSLEKPPKTEDTLGLKDLVGLIKDLNGLPSDSNLLATSLNSMLELTQFTGQSLDNYSIASMYIKFLSLASTAKFNKEKYEKAFQKVNENGGLNEVAIIGNKLVALDRNTGNIQYINPEKINELGDDMQILTNSNLLALRALNPNMAFNNSILDIVENGIGLTAVNNIIKDFIYKIGSNTNSSEGYSKKQENDFLAGVLHIRNAYLKGADITGMSLDGLYKSKILTKEQWQQAKYALNYIYTMLPTNAKTLLMARTGNMDGVKETIKNLIGSGLSLELNFEVDLIEDSEGNKPGSKEASKSEKLENSNPYLQLIREEGGYSKPITIVTKSGTTGIGVEGTWYSQLPKINSDMSIDELLSTGLLGIVESRDSITFGDLQIGSDKLKDVLYDNKGGTIATLPIKYDLNGNKIVNLNIIDLYKKVQNLVKALKEQNLSNLEFMQKWSELLKEYLLDELINPDTGLPNLKMFGQFLVVDAYTTDKTLANTKSEYIHKIKNPDSDLEEKLVKGLSTDKDKSNYKVDINNNYIFEGFWDDIYKANLYIPIINNPNAAINAWGDLWKEDKVSKNEEIYQNFNKLKTMKSTSSEML